jgi:hypothetical protein
MARILNFLRRPLSDYILIDLDGRIFAGSYQFSSRPIWFAVLRQPQRLTVAAVAAEKPTALPHALSDAEIRPSLHSNLGC